MELDVLHLLDRFVSRLMAGAGLIMAAAITAVAAAMAFYALCAPHLGPAWSYAALAGVAAVIAAAWAPLQSGRREKHRQGLWQRKLSRRSAPIPWPPSRLVWPLASDQRRLAQPVQALGRDLDDRGGHNPL
ncbi:hypothetical protein [Caulobacter segnis]